MRSNQEDKRTPQTMLHSEEVKYPSPDSESYQIAAIQNMRIPHLDYKD